NSAKLARALKVRIHPRLWKDSGDYHQWAEQWATDSVHQARAAYEGLIFVDAEVSQKGKLERIRIRLPAKYEDHQRRRAEDQLAKAGFHLASLLNQIQFR